MIVTLDDVKSFRYCNRGCRVFCERYGINWRDVKEHGIEADQLLALGDAMATDLVEHARQRAAGVTSNE